MSFTIKIKDEDRIRLMRRSELAKFANARKAGRMSGRRNDRRTKDAGKIRKEQSWDE